MSLIKTIPQDSRYLSALVRYTATFNNPTLGKYDFTIPANEYQLVLGNIHKNNVYIIERHSFSASISEADFLLSIEVVPTLQLFMNLDGMNQKIPIYTLPLPMVNYIDGAESIAYFVSPRDADSLVATFRGRLGQPPSMVGLLTVVCQVSLDVYEVTDSVWIKNYMSNEGREFDRQYI